MQAPGYFAITAHMDLKQFDPFWFRGSCQTKSVFPVSAVLSVFPQIIAQNKNAIEPELPVTLY